VLGKKSAKDEGKVIHNKNKAQEEGSCGDKKEGPVPRKKCPSKLAGVANAHMSEAEPANERKVGIPTTKQEEECKEEVEWASSPCKVDKDAKLIKKKKKGGEPRKRQDNKKSQALPRSTTRLAKVDNKALVREEEGPAPEGKKQGDKEGSISQQEPPKNRGLVPNTGGRQGKEGCAIAH